MDDLHQLQEFASTSGSHSHLKLARSVRLLWHRRRFLVRVSLFAAVLAAIVSLVVPPRYESTTRLLPAPAASPAGEITRMLRPEASAFAGLAGLNPGGGNEGRFLALLHSRVIADRIIDRFGLMKLYGAKYHHEARTALAGRTVITEDRKTGVIAITVADRDPKRACEIAGAYISQLEQLNADMNNSGAHMERVFLQDRIEEVNQELREAAGRLSQFSTKYSILDLQQQPKSTVEAALKLQGELIAAQADVRGLQAIYTDNSARVRAGSARVAELRRQLDQLQGTQSPAVPSDGSLPSIHNLPTLGVTYAELFRQTKLLEAVQLALTQQLEAAKTEEVRQLPVFRVMDPPEIPEQRVFPRRTLMVLISAFCGLLVAVAVVLGSDRWNRIETDDPLRGLVADARRHISSIAIIRPQSAWNAGHSQTVSMDSEDRQ